MMNFINDAFINAILADATYVLADDGLEGLKGTALFDYLKTRMPPSLAKYISENFTVVTHKETDDTLLSGQTGFDATVWQHNESEKMYVSFTGTQTSDWQFKDLITDADLTIGNGVPVTKMSNDRFRSGQQAFASVRYWPKPEISILAEI